MLQAEAVCKIYSSPAGPLPILENVNLSLARGEAAAIMGPSGSGKSTLLHLLGALDSPTSGRITLEGQNASALNPAQAAEFRNRKVGFVFQDHSLLPQCSVIENVLIPVLATGSADERDIARARALLDQVGLSQRLDHRPAELSGGEQQRTAVARALIRDPLLVLCDEPTGNLDRASAESVAQLLLELHARQNTILVVVTHSAGLAERFPRRFELRDRRLQ